MHMIELDTYVYIYFSLCINLDSKTTIDIKYILNELDYLENSTLLYIYITVYILEHHCVSYTIKLIND